MLRKFGFFVVVFGLAFPALAADSPASISGYVRSSTGTPQMGAVVEVVSTAAHGLRVFTDGSGFYSMKDLLPGTYTLKVTAPSFLPALRERIGLHSGSSLVVNITLSTLFNAMELGPIRGPADDDDWKWTLIQRRRRSRTEGELVISCGFSVRGLWGRVGHEHRLLAGAPDPYR
jgi:hypothetical protein